MIVKCWGARGSVPVSGRHYLKYGGDTTCLEIRTLDGRIIIVDAGTGIRNLGRDLVLEGRFEYDMLFTHAHWDHLLGFPFFLPLYHHETRINMQGCPFAQQFIASMLEKVMSPPNFPVNYRDIKARVTYTPECTRHMEMGSVTTIPIRISHPNLGNGYKFIEGEKAFVFLTDNELDVQHEGGETFSEYQKFVAGADLLIHDAEYSEKDYEQMKGWGHSLYTSALSLAMKAGVKRFGLFHHNQWKSDAEIDRMVDACRDIVKKSGVEMECFAVGPGMVFTV